MGVNFLNISSFQKIHILVAGSDQATYYAHSVLPSISHGIYPRTIFLYSRCQKFNLRYIWKIIIFPFSKRKKNNLTSLRSSEKSHRFSDTKGLSTRELRPRKIVFLFLLLSAFWWVGIVPIWLHYFPSAACDFRLFINEILSVILFTCSVVCIQFLALHSG